VNCLRAATEPYGGFQNVDTALIQATKDLVRLGKTGLGAQLRRLEGGRGTRERANLLPAQSAGPNGRFRCDL
jgi:hypothetical protein